MYIFLDTETTGTNTAKDRIVELALVKVDKDLNTIDKELLKVNPGIPIPLEASKVHGIYDKDVALLGTLGIHKERIEKIFDGVTHLGGQNILRFDLPLLGEEFIRHNINIDLLNYEVLDTLINESNINKRDLGTLFKKYTGSELVDAHSALVDTEASLEVLKGQLNSGFSVVEFTDFSKGDVKYMDLARSFYMDENGVVKFAFGKYKDKDIKTDVSYLTWMLNNDFPETTKQFIRKYL